MRILKSFVRRTGLARSTKGQDIIEYALIAGFLAVTTAATIPGAVTSVNSLFSEVKSALATSISGGIGNENTP